MSEMLPDPVHARDELRRVIDAVLLRMGAERAPTRVEVERVDIKE